MKPERISLMDLDNFYRNHWKDMCSVMSLFTTRLAMGDSETAAFYNALDHYFHDDKLLPAGSLKLRAAIVLSLLFSDQDENAYEVSVRKWEKHVREKKVGTEYKDWVFSVLKQHFPFNQQSQQNFSQESGEKTAKRKIIIEVSGGLVKKITANDDLSIFIVDHDNLKERGSDPSEIYMPQAPDRITKSNEEFKKILNKIAGDYPSGGGTPGPGR